LLSEILAYANGNVSSAAWIQKIAAAMRIEFDYDAIDAIGLTLAALLPRERRSKWAMSWLEAFSDIAGLCHKKGPGQ
jgi:hypothetical protein